MRNVRLRLALVSLLFCSAHAAAELQNVEIGGSIEVFAGWYTDFYETNSYQRYPAAFLPGRPLGAGGTASNIRADGKGNSLAFVEQRTRLHAAADFTNNVTAFLELEAIDDWGSDFRSNYLNGADMRAVSVDDVEFFQAYIDVDNLFGQPIRLRIGRQEMSFGSGWLVGTNATPNPFTGLSFDALRLTYSGEKYSVDAWWSKLSERSPIEEDGDVDFYGVYASYTGIENVVFDVYWLYVRDALSIEDQQLPLLGEWAERVLGLDDYSPTSLHTIGFRNCGSRGPYDWELEGAYQFGNADAVGATFPVPFLPLRGAYGNDASWSTWGAHGEAGYTFDVSWHPRVYLGGHYYYGEDNRGIDFWQWFNPFHKSKPSVSFNRLFSDHEIDYFLDWSGISNSWEFATGVSATPTDKINVCLGVTYQAVVEPFDHPPYFSVGPWRIPVLPGLSFVSEEGRKALGWQTSLCLSYAYSEDLSFEIGWAHFFVGKGLEDGAFANDNGMTFFGGRGDHDADSVFLYTSVSF